MDFGHYNCRDYHISPSAATRIHTARGAPILYRHESWTELEQRARSPASTKPKFPLLQLPLELRQQIFSYLLPRTTELRGSSPLANHARNFSAVRKRRIAPPPAPTAAALGNAVWHKGHTGLFAVCRQLHAECTDLVYGGNPFIVFISFAGISIRFRFLLSSGLAPTFYKDDFLDWMPRHYRVRIRNLVVHVDHVDQYTGQIKFNVGGKGLTHGLRRQAQRLVDALKPEADKNDEELRRLARLDIRVSNGSSVTDSIKSELDKQRDGPRVSRDIEIMLAPFLQLRGVRSASVSGAVTAEFAAELEESMRSLGPVPEELACSRVGDGGMQDPPPGVQMCVYGNDI